MVAGHVSMCSDYSVAVYRVSINPTTVYVRFPRPSCPARSSGVVNLFYVSIFSRSERPQNGSFFMFCLWQVADY